MPEGGDHGLFVGRNEAGPGLADDIGGHVGEVEALVDPRGQLTVAARHAPGRTLLHGVAQVRVKGANALGGGVGRRRLWRPG